MITRFKPDYNFKEIKSIIKKEKDNVYDFEKKFSNILGYKYAVSFPSGRSGLYSILKALKISQGEVIIPGYNCIVVPPAILASGNIPSFVDISLKDYNIDVSGIREKITDKTKAIIPTHMYGNPSDVKQIREIVGDETLIIEDAAQAILTKDVGKYGDVSFYSFNFEKQIFTFGGGMVTTNNEEIYEKLRSFKQRNLNNETSDSLTKTFLLLSTPLIFNNYIFRITCSLWHLNASRIWEKKNWQIEDEHLPVEKIYLSGDLEDKFSINQATVGLSQLNRIKEDINKRREIAKQYCKYLEELETIVIPYFDNESSYSHYTIRTNDRNEFELFMRKKGIQINKVFDYSLPHLARYKKYITEKEQFRNSYIAGKNNVNLPAYPYLIEKPSKIRYIVDSVIKYDKKNQNIK